MIRSTFGVFFFTAVALAQQPSSPSIAVDAVAQAGGTARVTITATPGGFVVQQAEVRVASETGTPLGAAHELGGDGTVTIDVRATAWSVVDVQALVGTKAHGQPQVVTASATVFPVPGSGVGSFVQRDLRYPSGLARNSSAIFWTERWDSFWDSPQPDTSQGRIWTAGLDGSNPHVIVSGERQPVGIAADDRYLYWTNFGTGFDGAVIRYDLLDGTRVVLADNEPFVGFGILASGGRVYWCSGFGTRTIFGDQVVTLNLNAGVNLATDGSHLFLTQYGDPSTPGPNNGRVLQIPITGGPELVLASGQAQPWDVHTDGTYVVWANQAWQQPFPGTINRVPVGGGPIVTLATATDPPGFPAELKTFGMDSRFVYYVGNWQLYATPIAGGPTYLVSNAAPGGCPEGMSLLPIGHDIYWTDTCANALVRVRW